MFKLLNIALQAYLLDTKCLIIDKKLHQSSWNKDLHFKINLNGIGYSARFIGDDRSPNTAFGEMNDQILLEQTRFCRHLINHGIPFMHLVETKDREPFIILEWEGQRYRFILHRWIEGQHTSHFDPQMAERFGQVSRWFHDVGSTFTSKVFRKKSHLVGYRNFMEMLFAENPPAMLNNYLSLVAYHVKRAETAQMDYLIQSDLNPQNVLWEDREVRGIVDFESIGYGDRIEGLAWLLKWYSRADGKDASLNAKAFLSGYRAEEYLHSSQLDRLTSLIWLSGCLNWKFVQNTLKMVKDKDNFRLKNHLEFYQSRGEELTSLLR